MNKTNELAGTVILVTDDGMGRGQLELRHKLIRVYLTMLLENGLLPDAICFYAEGVKMVVEGSPVLDLLGQLESKGVLLLSCATCLNYYSLAEKLVAGVIGGMHDIVVAQWQSTKVITI